MYKYKKQRKMKAQSAKKFKGKRIQNSKVLHCVPQFDRISDLPWPILDNILCRLPIQDAVRTSVLSRKWRDKWVNLSKLVFDDSFLGDKKDVNRLVYAVYHVLLSHCGSIDTFKLFTRNRPAFIDSDFDRWIHFLSRNSIKELSLEYVSRELNSYKLPSVFSAHEFKYELPSCLFSCQQLTHLHITNVLLEPPDTFHGFRNLVHLQLDTFVNKTEVLASLVCVCPVLERLVLKIFENLAPFSIQALKLKYLYVAGRLALPIVLKNCPALVDISLLGDELDISEYQLQGSICHLVDDLSCLTNLERLNISSWFLTYLYRWDTDVSELSFTPSSHFKVLQIHSICLGDLYRTIMIASLFSNVQELYVSAEDLEQTEDYSVKLEGHRPGCSFDRLQIVKIQLAHGGEHDLELEFIKFVLALSPKLKRMTIVCSDTFDFKILVMEGLLSFERASAGARIVFLPDDTYVFCDI
ncbi:F-box/FBD/LRR-repeat protein [Melia azedarach]|uniref:F-box/FBD/LRR-repeat protein n=1 Tax=Melia azedarach TaxID=155640 RepID=A0ACC1X913_MELAZ|nr:F-box/FBD/LRR-repeat protein [Melia azedarach]